MLILSYVLSAAFIMGRTYYFIDDSRRWIRYNLFIIFGFCATFIAARVNIKLKRENFIQKQNMK